MHGGAAREESPAASDAATGIVGRLQRVVDAAPDAVAVSDEAGRLSFREVAELAASVREAVRAAVEGLGGPVRRTRAGSPGGPDPVALIHGQRAGAVAAALGVVASGHPLLVLDAAESRWPGLVEAAGVRVVVCDAAGEATAARLGRRVVVVGRDTGPASEGRLWADPPAVGAVATLVPAEDLEEGCPRLAAVDHGTLDRERDGRARAVDGLSSADTIAVPVPVTSSAGLSATMTALLAGARTCLYDLRVRGADPFGDWVQDAGATVLFAHAPLLRSVLKAWPWPEQYAGLRAVVVGGEAAHAREVEEFRALLPSSCVLHGWYATPEGGLLAQNADDAPPGGAPAAGRAVDDRELVVVDDAGRPLPPGDVGEITALRRHHLFPGYWLDPEATGRAVTVNPDGSCTLRTGDLGRFDPDGVLHVLGRVADDVRIGDHVVHPAEVGAALSGLPEVREAVVVGVAPHDGRPGYLVAYVVPDADQPSAARLRAALRAVLPAQLVPGAVLYLDALPRTDTGAVDRSRLPPAPPRPPATGEQAPTTSMEDLVAQIWAEVLELDQVGRTEDFFQLGGDSLSAEALISRVTADLGVGEDVCTTSLLIEAPTVAEFAARLRGRPAVRRGPLVALNRAGCRPPLFIMAGAGGLGIAFVSWARQLGPDQPTWALQCPALEGRGLPDRSVRAIGRANAAAIRSVQPEGPYYLAGYSFGGLVALETARRLRADGDEVGLLAIIDSFPPEPALLPPLPRRAPIQKVRDLAGVTLMSARSTPGGREHWRFQDHAVRLARRYTAPPWDGRAVVLVGDSDEKGLRSAWAPHLSGDWRLVDVPGDHLSLTRMPWARTVAEALTAELAAARDGS